jgi:hypothetical protein
MRNFNPEEDLGSNKQYGGDNWVRSSNLAEDKEVTVQWRKLGKENGWIKRNNSPDHICNYQHFKKESAPRRDLAVTESGLCHWVTRHESEECRL